MRRSGFSDLTDAVGDAVADLLVDVAPVLECPSQHRRRHAVAEMSHDVGDETIPLGGVHDFAHQRAGLAPVVVVTAERVGGMNELTVGIPSLDIGKALGIGRRAALRVGGVHGSATLSIRMAPSLL